MPTDSQASAREGEKRISIQSSDDSAPSDVVVATEAIVVIDLIESTATSDRFGWYAAGRELMRDLRALITTAGEKRGLRCRKSTGDGYLLAYRDPGSQAAEIGAAKAVEASFELLDRLVKRNSDPDLAEEQAINVRIAIHFGQVDIIHLSPADELEGDREGPNVSFAFRLEGIGQDDVEHALRPSPDEVPPDEVKDLPLENYVLCSEQVTRIIKLRCKNFSTFLLGHFKLKGFSSRHEVHLVSHK